MASPPLRSAVAGIALALVAVVLAPPAQAGSLYAKMERWSSTTELKTGSSAGVAIANGSMRVSTKPAGTTSFADPYGSKKSKSYDYGMWTSPWVATGFDATSMIGSWKADALNGTWLRVEMRSKTRTKTSSWDTIADWGHSTTGVYRASGSSQPDDLTRLSTDTVIANDANKLRNWQIKVTLFRPVGTTSTPRLDSVGAIASSFVTRSAGVSSTTMTASKELKVPRYSQMIHKGEFTQWGGGGVAWCSPTSTSMVMRYFGKGPKPADYSWSKYADSHVDHAARYTYDHRYEGNGNWPFNTAYAGRYGLDTFVTKLYNLREAEAFIKAGIPVVASIAFGRGELTGAPISASEGHILVITGFSKDGRVIANDPAAPNNSTVRRVYNRAQFERAWLTASGGVTYVMRPMDVALPPDTARW